MNIFQIQLFCQANINELNILSDEDALCYLKNYPDLKFAFGENIEAAKNHWKTIGLREKRVKDCCASLRGPDTSDEDAPCYLNNYPELKSAFDENIGAAKNHWWTYGVNEERVKDCVPLQKYKRQFVKSVSSSIYFVSDGLLYPVANCKPCGQLKSLCDGIPVIIVDKKYLLGSKIQPKSFYLLETKLALVIGEVTSVPLCGT